MVRYNICPSWLSVPENVANIVTNNVLQPLCLKDIMQCSLLSFLHPCVHLKYVCGPFHEIFRKQSCQVLENISWRVRIYKVTELDFNDILRPPYPTPPPLFPQSLMCEDETMMIMRTINIGDVLQDFCVFIKHGSGNLGGNSE